MNNIITIIGIGSLGGFLAEEIIKQKNVKKLILIDYDRVEEKNIYSSIYTSTDIHQLKVDALKRILSRINPHILIETLNIQYKEGETKLQQSDLVIDCRDFICNRYNEIDVRCYISSGYLVLDCRKNVKYTSDKEGRYLYKLPVSELRFSALILSRLIENNIIQTYIQKEIIKQIDLSVDNLMDECFDAFCNESSNGQKFINLPDKIDPLVEMNKNKKCTIYMGNREEPISQQTLPLRSFQDKNDVLTSISKLAYNHTNFDNFLISVNETSKCIYIELIPETGAA